MRPSHLGILCAVAAAGCRHDNDERLGLDDKRPSAPVEVASLAREGGLEKALATPAAEIAARISSWRLAQTATLTIAAGERKETLEETWNLEVDGRGGAHSVVENSHGTGFETVIADNTVYVRPRHGRYSKHAPEGDEIDRVRDHVQGVLAGWLSVLGRFAERKDEGDTVAAGRKARRIRLSLAGSPARLRDTTPARAWRKSVHVTALAGSVDIDIQSGAPLHAELEASWTEEQAPRHAGGPATPLALHLSYRGETTQVGALPAITAPEGPLVPAVRTRPLVERQLLLDGLTPSTIGGPVTGAGGGLKEP